MEPFVLADIGYGTVDLVTFKVDQHTLVHATTTTCDDFIHFTKCLGSNRMYKRTL